MILGPEKTEYQDFCLTTIQVQDPMDYCPDFDAIEIYTESTYDPNTEIVRTDFKVKQFRNDYHRSYYRCLVQKIRNCEKFDPAQISKLESIFSNFPSQSELGLEHLL